MGAGMIQEEMGRRELYSGKSKYRRHLVSMGDWFQDPRRYQNLIPLYKMAYEWWMQDPWIRRAECSPFWLQHRIRGREQWGQGREGKLGS